jgi:hypothetical protein
MRDLKTAVAVIALSLAFAGSASAEPWSDPSGRLSFNTPGEWTTRQEVGDAPADPYTYVITGDASNECHIMAQPNPGTAAASADAVRRANDDDNRFNSALWTQIANGVRNIFPNQSASVVSNNKEVASWPIQRAEIQSSQRLVRAAMQLRPGIDILTFCMNYEGTERPDLYDALIRSVGHPNDAVFFADAAAAQAARDAAEAQAVADAQTQEDLQEMAETGRPPERADQQPTGEESREARRARIEELRRRTRGR